MSNDVVYNQVLSFNGDSIDCRTIMKSYVEEGKLILVLEDAEKLFIDGKHVDTTGHKDRIPELLARARERGFEIEPKAVTHYASSRAEEEPVEYVLVKW
jgi:hypothetical protein